MPSQEERKKALELAQEAIEHQMAGDFDEAIRLYKLSIATCPTADAHTYLGWVYSMQGKIDKAIAECEVAIKIDPDFGNPYNDIGVYLMQQQKLDEAIPWLEKAKKAERYEPRHFPFLNLGQIFATKGMINRALEEFRGALEFNAEDPQALRAIEELESNLQ